MNRIDDTLLESETDKWARVLQAAGIPISPEELNDLRIAHGGVVYTGTGGPTMSKARMREIVTSYMQALLATEEQHG